MANMHTVSIVLAAAAAALAPNTPQPHIASRNVAQNVASLTEADALLAQAAQLRREAATLEQELRPVTVAEGANNVLPLPKTPKWKTQLWIGDDAPLRAAWRLLENGAAEVENHREAGWKLVDHANRKLLECWFWKGDEKVTLKAYATPQYHADKLLEVAERSRANMELCEKRLREAEAADESNPFAFAAKMSKSMFAADELLSARVVHRECEAQAALARGPSVDLDGVAWVLAEQGSVTAAPPDATQPARLGTFASWRGA